MTNSQIRPMRKTDWISFEILDKETFPEDRVEKSHFDRYLASDAFFALESDTGELVGYLKITDFKDETGFVGRIAVAKTHQRQGLGSQLMEYCLQWFRERRVRQIDLNTQDFNVSALRLYEKFGFNRIGTIWHYFVKFDVLQPPSRRYSAQPLFPEEISQLVQMFPKTMPLSRIQIWLDRADQHLFTLKNREGQIVGACVITPSFPGCWPFELKHLDGLDDFVAGFRHLIPPEFDYLRLTFAENPDLAAVLEERQCKLHHRLYWMRLELKS
jgi:ribosomal-protein-alanine N-acetyltransferase